VIIEPKGAVDPLLTWEFDGPFSDAEMDALEAVWKPLGLLSATLIGSPVNVERYIDWRDRWNDRRAISYWDGDPWVDVD
jgi:hypothetical protein